MNRTKIAAILLVCFMVSFAFSGVNAVCTIKETTQSTFVNHLFTLYSLSSPAALVLAVLVVLALLALLSFAADQRNVGFLFTAIAAVLYVVFLLMYTAETRNNTVYNILNEQFKAAGARVKKRDFNILMTPSWTCYLTAVLAFVTAGVALPNFKTEQTRYRLKVEIEPYLFIAPHVLLFIVFSLVPIIYGLYAAFTSWDLINEPVFVGLRNFKTILFDSTNTYYTQLRNGLWNTVKFMLIVTPACIVVPFAIALATRQVTKGSKALQAIYYLPSLLATTTVMLSWKYFFNNTYGMANNLFGSTWNWFAPPYTWVMMLIITVWWSTGGTMVLYQSALASVPADLYEAASIDGANTIQKFIHVTIPDMSYTLLYTFVTTVVAQLNVYGQPNILTGYDYQGANAVLLMYIRDIAFTDNIAGIASSMALILGLVIMSISFFQIRMMRGDVDKPKKARRKG